MTAFLTCEDGPYAGMSFPLEEDEVTGMGRDPDTSSLVLEDPMVSRRHACFQFSQGVWLVKNESEVNPTLLNGNHLIDEEELHEGDTLTVGNNIFRFSLQDPRPAAAPVEEESVHEIPEFSLTDTPTTRFVLKVISGPNSGAEFGLNPGDFVVLGKDPDHCDLIFQDLSVSRKHARIEIDAEGLPFVEDLQSRNGTLLNGIAIHERSPLQSQDLISLGTTSFLIIDREETRETIYSPASSFEASKELFSAEPKQTPDPKEEESKSRNIRDIFIPFRHLAIAAVFLVAMFIGVVGVISLFHSERIEMAEVDETAGIRHVLKNFPTVEFSYNPSNATIFLTGNTLTEVDHHELIYLLRSLPDIRSIEDNIVVDEIVWENMNPLLAKNPNYRGVSFTSTAPGQFMIRGYVETAEEKSLLQDWIHMNFPFTDKLFDDVVVEETLDALVKKALMEAGFANITFKASNGEVLVNGRVNNTEEKLFQQTLAEIKGIHGVRVVKNFVIFTTAATKAIDITNKYRVTGSSKFGNINQYVLIGGRILSVGDQLDGMTITEIGNESIHLEKDGVKYKIDYNLQ